MSNTNKPLQKKMDKKTETLTALLTSTTKTEAAERLGISRPALYDRIKAFELQSYLDQYYEDAMEVLSKGTVQAALKQVDLTKSRNEKIALEASAEVLDRAGLTKKQANTTNVQVNIANVLDDERGKYDD